MTTGRTTVPARSSEQVASEDHRVRYFRSETNLGAAANFNRTVHLARAPFFCWAAADDLRSPLFAERCLAALAESPDAVLAYPQAVDIGPGGGVIKHWGPMPRAVDSDPVERFRDVLENERVAFSVFGVMRLDVLRSTQLIAPFAGSDWALLAELALLGRFIEIDEELFLHREHPDRSTRVYSHSRDRAEWFDTSKAGRTTYPYWSLAGAYVVPWQGDGLLSRSVTAKTDDIVPLGAIRRPDSHVSDVQPDVTVGRRVLHLQQSPIPQ